jgi:hypothetical protein
MTSKKIIGPCPDINRNNHANKCPKGQIMRKSIEDKGKPGKGPVYFTIPKEDIGLLEKYNYSLKNNFEERIKSLKKANKALSKLNVLRYINAIRTLQKSHEKYYNKLDKDMKWLQENYSK